MAVFKVWGIDQSTGQMKSVEDTDTANIVTANDATLTLTNQVNNVTLPVATIDGYGFIQFTQTTANITITLPSPTSATKGKSTIFTNAPTSTQPITVTSSGGDTVTLQIGQSCNLVWNGSAWRRFPATPLIPPKVTIFTSSGTFTKDPASLYAIVEGVGGGGSGGYGFGQAGPNTSYVGCGGGSGAYFKAMLTSSQLGTTQAVTIGAGGGTGAAGGATTFGTLLTANGGSSGAGVYTFSGTTGLTSSTMTPTMSRATFTINTGVNLGSQLGNLPTNAFVASATGNCVAITSDGADSEMGRGARGLKSNSSPPHLTTPGNFVAQAAAANTGGGGSGDSTYSPNASTGTATTQGAGGSGIVRITEYYQ